MRLPVRFILSVGIAAFLAGCNESSDSKIVGPSTMIAAAAPVKGIYELHFLNSLNQEVASLQFGQAVRLQAIIKDASEALAQQGSVTFQLARARGRPVTSTRWMKHPSKNARVAMPSGRRWPQTSPSMHRESPWWSSAVP
jgi:hypothetical protein